MKFKLILILVFICTCNLFCQENQWSINLEGLSTTKGLFSYPSVGYQDNKIKIQGGFLFGQEYVNNESVIGGQLDFFYFPNKEEIKKINFFFNGSVHYFSNTTSLNFSEVNTNFFQATLGYGFTYLFSEKWGVKSNFGIGGLLENRTFNFQTNDPSNKFGFAGIISIGVNYKL